MSAAAPPVAPPADGPATQQLDDDVARLRTSARRRRLRSLAVAGGLAAGLVLAFLASLSIDDVPVSVPDVVRTLLGNGSEFTDYLVLESRLPRAISAIAVGACFGMSGAIFQALVRNPLATPDIIGVTSGASAFAVVSATVLGLESLAVSAMAVVGGVVAAALIYALAWRNGLASYRLVLVGIALSAVFAAGITWTFSVVDSRSAQQALIWISGSLNEVVAPTAWRAVAFVVVLVPLGLLLARRLAVVSLGDDVARGLGERLETTRLALLVVAVLLASCATSIGGPIQFVAFLAAPIARWLTRDGSASLLTSAGVGALIVLTCDVVGEQAFGDLRLPVGVVTGLVGAPYLLLLLSNRSRKGSVA